MLSLYKGHIPIISDDPDTVAQAFPDGLPDGARVSYGYVPRDYDQYPEEMFAPPTDLQLIPESEWDARYEEEEATKSSLEHLYLQGGNNPLFVNLDQNGDGYCWIYSNGHAAMFVRAQMNLPLVRLNPHSAGAIIKNGRDEGGWCGLGAKFLESVGMAEEGSSPGQWPLHSRSLRYDTPECRAQMKRFQTTEGYYDLTRREYDQQLTIAQLATCGFSRFPCPTDYNWWGHSVCMIRWVRIERGSWGPLILNSWKGWGRFGLAVLQGNKGRPDGSVCHRVARAA